MELWTEKKSIVLKWVIVSLKVNIFRKPRKPIFRKWLVPVSGKCLWLVFSELFEEKRCRLLKRLSWGKEGYSYTQERLHAFFIRWVFIGKFSKQAKVLRFKVVFHLVSFFDLTNVSVQVILFPLNLVLMASLTFF